LTPKSPAFLFDLDGTLVDSVYLHVIAWAEALEGMGLHVATWRIHQRIGMSDDLIAHGLAEEIRRETTEQEEIEIRKRHSEAFLKRADQVRLLPGAKEILSHMTDCGVRWTIATSSNRQRAQRSLDLLGVGKDVPVVTREAGMRGKPNPDLFLKAAEQLKVPPEACIVVGDSLWDLLAARRAGALGVGVRSGGYAEAELSHAGAYRVYDDTAALLRRLDELGIGGPHEQSLHK
jgi:HAD superfamily hydrolase (TIGR01509 family)